MASHDTCDEHHLIYNYQISATCNFSPQEEGTQEGCLLSFYMFMVTAGSVKEKALW